MAVYLGSDRVSPMGYAGNSGGPIDSTSIPTADKIAEFDSEARMNSTDMTNAEIDTYINELEMGEASIIDEEVLSLYTSLGWVQD